MAHAYHWLMVHRSECSRSKSSANCKTYATNCAKKKYDAELPKLRPPISPPPHYYKKLTNSGLIRIQQELTTKKVNEIVIRNSKLKR